MTARARGERRLSGRGTAVAAPADRRFRRAHWPVDRRRRITRIAKRVVRWGLPAVAGLALLAWAGAALIGADALRVHNIHIRGNERLSQTDVLALLPGLEGESILRADLDAYGRRLLESPWVADVSIFRVLPATVEIHLIERAPMAIARIGHQLYLVDETGVVIDEYGPDYPEIDLPIVDGLVPSPAAAGPLVDAGRIQLAGAVLSALAQEPALARRLSQVDVSNAQDAMVMFDDDPIWLHLGREDFGGRVRRYLELRETLHDRFEGIDYVDLRFDERVFLHGRHVASQAE